MKATVETLTGRLIEARETRGGTYRCRPRIEKQGLAAPRESEIPRAPPLEEDQRPLDVVCGHPDRDNCHDIRHESMEMPLRYIGVNLNG